jgi:transposase-like protein
MTFRKLIRPRLRRSSSALSSYRDNEEIRRERGLSIDHTTIYRRVQAYGPELEKRIRPYLRLTNASYHVDETYVKIKGAWKYLYRAVDPTGQTGAIAICFATSSPSSKTTTKALPSCPAINLDFMSSYIFDDG